MNVQMMPIAERLIEIRTRLTAVSRQHLAALLEFLASGDGTETEDETLIAWLSHAMDDETWLLEQVDRLGSARFEGCLAAEPPQD